MHCDDVRVVQASCELASRRNRRSRSGSVASGPLIRLTATARCSLRSNALSTRPIPLEPSSSSRSNRSAKTLRSKSRDSPAALPAGAPPRVSRPLCVCEVSPDAGTDRTGVWPGQAAGGVVAAGRGSVGSAGGRWDSWMLYLWFLVVWTPKSCRILPWDRLPARHLGSKTAGKPIPRTCSSLGPGGPSYGWCRGFVSNQLLVHHAILRLGG